MQSILNAFGSRNVAFSHFLSFSHSLISPLITLGLYDRVIPKGGRKSTFPASHAYYPNDDDDSQGARVKTKIKNAGDGRW